MTGADDDFDASPRGRRPWRAWLIANQHDTAPLTGGDTRAMEAIDACWEVYCGGDDEARHNAICAVASLLFAMQEKCWPLAKALIPRSMDWGDEEPVWKLVLDHVARRRDLESRFSRLRAHTNKVVGSLTEREREVLRTRLGRDGGT